MTHPLDQMRHDAAAAALLAEWPTVVEVLRAAKRLADNEREATTASNDRADELDDACPALTKALALAVAALPPRIQKLVLCHECDGTGERPAPWPVGPSGAALRGSRCHACGGTGIPKPQTEEAKS